MAFKKSFIAPIVAATLAAYATPSEGAVTILPGSSNSSFVTDELRGIAGDNDQIRVYGDGAVHNFSRDLTSPSTTVTQSGTEDAMVYSTTLDSVTDGGNGFSGIDIADGSSEFIRGFAGSQQTHALHGAVSIGGVDYTLATTSNPTGELSTAWYNTTNPGLGALVQTIDLTSAMAELGISTASDVTGGAMYLAEGGDATNLSHYILMWNTTELIGQYNPLNGNMNSFETGADGIADIHVQGNDLYVVDALAPGIGSVSRHDFSDQHFSIPEPSSAALLGLGALGALAYRRRE